MPFLQKKRKDYHTLQLLEKSLSFLYDNQYFIRQEKAGQESNLKMARSSVFDLIPAVFASPAIEEAVALLTLYEEESIAIVDTLRSLALC
jgi:hypothetical protein